MLEGLALLKVLANPKVLEFIASYVVTKGLDGALDSAGKQLAIASPEFQIIDALSTALCDTCQHFNMEYNATLAEEMFLRSVQEEGVNLTTQRIKEILLKTIGTESIQYAGEKIFGYWVYSFNKALAAPARQWANSLVQIQTISRIEDSMLQPQQKKKQSLEKYKMRLQDLMKKTVPYDTFTLEEIYVQLYGFYKVYDEVSHLVKSYSIFRTEEWIYQWVSNLNEKNILLISGKPASGKTTLMKKLAGELIVRQLNVVFIPLKKFNFGTNFHQSVCDFCRKEIGYDLFAESDDWRNIVLLFDGLDEIALRGVKSLERAVEFVELLVKEYSGSEVKIIISGRDLAVSAVSNLFIHNGREYILHLFPLYFDSEYIEQYWPGASGNEIKDLRPIWWENYGTIRGIDYSDKQYEIMKSINCVRKVFDEITGEPFLLYLLASCYEAKVWDFESKVSSGTLYRYFIKKVYLNEWKDDSNSQFIISEDVFLDFLKEVSLCSWFSGKQIIPLTALKERCENSRFQPIISRLAGGANSSEGLAGLLLLFYIDESSKDENEQSFEFTHKSFSDYFIGLKISEFVIKTFSPNDVVPECYGEIFNILGRSYLNLYIDDFMCQEFERIFIDSPEKIISARKHILNFFQKIVVHGEEFACNSERAGDVLPHEAYKMLSKNLFRIMGALAKIRGERIIISSQHQPVFVDWINSDMTWYGAEIDSPDDYATNVMKLIEQVNFNKIFLGGIQLPNYEIAQCNFDSAFLPNANLWYATIVDAVFMDFTLTYADLNCATVLRSEFSKGAFTGANFSQTFLREVTFENCKFDRAIFIETQIRQVTFKNCKFDKCYFINVAMERVVFEQCSFDGFSYQSEFKSVEFIQNSDGLKQFETKSFDCAPTEADAQDIEAIPGNSSCTEVKAEQ